MSNATMIIMLALRRLLILVLTLWFSLGMGITPAHASVSLDDQFEASYACEAFQSIRKRTNPGDIRLLPGQIYPVTAKNKDDATHYYLKIETAEPQQRWVDTSCGKLLGSSDDISNPVTSSDNLLAISWQPAFCENHQDKTECETQTTERFDAENFTLHGLWPQPRGNDYCNVSNEIIALDRNSSTWSQLPPITLSEELFQELQRKMPGVASDLHLHEWYKHGTCYSETPEEYYHESLALLDQVNNSPVQELFAANIGADLTSEEILAEFDTAFGNNAGNKVAIDCDTDPQPANREMIVELKLNLLGEIESDTTMAELFTDSETVRNRNVCSVGEVDPVGFD
ncbi:MAG: ribonuclease [Cyanobacteria bacterium P01_A01_bin.83]